MAREDGLNLSGNSKRTGPPDGYYDTGRKDSQGRPVYKKTQGRAAGGDSTPPPSAQTPMDDHGAASGDPDRVNEFSDDVTIAQEIEGLLGDHDNVRGVHENDDGVHEIDFRSGTRVQVDPSGGDDDEVELTLHTYDDEDERIEKVASIKREDLGEALLKIADGDEDSDGGGSGMSSMLPLMAAEGLFGRRGRRGFRRKKRGGGGDGQQRGISAHLVRRFFSMIIPWQER